MKAYIFDKKGSIRLSELPIPELVENEDDFSAILKPRYISICSSDIHTIYESNGPRRENLVLGHEGLAEIVQIGKKVRDFKVGDLVAVSAIMPEDESGNNHQNYRFSSTKLGRNIDGMWAEYFKIPDVEYNLVHIPVDMTKETALLSIDVLATAYTALKAAKISDNDDVLIIGSGAIALMCIAMIDKARNIYCIGTDKDCHVQLAKEYGCNYYISYKDGKILYPEDYPVKDLQYDIRNNSTNDKAVDTILKMTRLKGISKIIIAASADNNIAKACDLLGYGDSIAVNISYLNQEKIVLPTFSLGKGMADKTFRFVLSKGGRKWIEEVFGLVKTHNINPDRLISHHLKGFESIPEAIKMMKNRKDDVIKIMIEL